MNLINLFATQKVLRDRIGYNEPDRFNKLILALLVELGECANEWRGFKFWSKNQQPRTKASRNAAMMEEDKEYYNPLLEEYVDGLHFVLEIGIDLSITKTWYGIYTSKSIELQFLFVYEDALKIRDNVYSFGHYEQLICGYLGLGEMLGFTWEEVEQAYFAKNQINHARQDSGTY